MTQPNDEANPFVATSRGVFAIMMVAALMAGFAVPASAGPIRQNVKARQMTILQKTSTDPWGLYWKSALKYRWMDVRSPRAVTLLRVSPDGTVPNSPMVQYLMWRQSRNVKQFNTFHPALVRLLRRVKPSTIPPMATPIEPPNFTPINPSLPQGLNPPQVPEPATGVMAVLMVGSAVVARRWRKS